MKRAFGTRNIKVCFIEAVRLLLHTDKVGASLKNSSANPSLPSLRINGAVAVRCRRRMIILREGEKTSKKAKIIIFNTILFHIAKKQMCF